MDIQKNRDYTANYWDKYIVPTLQEYISIPNKSPQFDANWQTHGYMAQAVELIKNWCDEHAIPDMTLDVVQLENRTPVILIEIPGQAEDTVLLYGHLDKQPEMVGWDDDLDPWKPVLKGEKLYGRGGADDGYAAFASLTAIKSLREQNIPHARCVILIEACEESGSYDLPFYIDALKDRIGTPSLVICLDSGCGNYEQLWMTTSLRGLVGFTVTIETLTEGIHSGMGSGIAPSCFRVLRQVLNRIDNEETGDIKLNALHVDIPDIRVEQANLAASELGHMVYSELPFVAGAKPESDDMSDLLLRRTWKPSLSVIGMNNIPSIEDAGNVTLPKVTLKCSMRIPPTCNPEKAHQALKEAVESNPPNGAKVTFELNDTGPGWHAPVEAEWLKQAASDASVNYFGKPSLHMGEGGSIPFMGMLGEKFPEAQFMITGVLGPKSNAHGPNEFLHIPMGKKLTACVAEVIAKHFER